MDPDRLGAVLAGELEGVHVGLRNVDLRLRQNYETGFGLVIDTAVGEGTSSPSASRSPARRTRN
jgi:two-component system LytT family sensor kinase